MQTALTTRYKRNVGTAERGLSALVGALLVRLGVKRLASLTGLAATAAGGSLIYRGVTGYCSLYGKLGIDSTAGGRDAKRGLLDNRSLHVAKSITIERPVKDVFRFCLNLGNLSHFSHYFGDVHKTSEGNAKWVIKGPGNMQMTCDIELTEERDNERISWRTLPGARIHHSGTLRLRETTDGEGTEVRLSLDFTPPGGVLGAGLGKLSQPLVHLQVLEALRRMKQVLEVKEIATTHGQPTGRLRKGRRLAVKGAAGPTGTAEEKPGGFADLGSDEGEVPLGSEDIYVNSRRARFSEMGEADELDPELDPDLDAKSGQNRDEDTGRRLH
jgi:uncharacterized membrane protein